MMPRAGVLGRAGDGAVLIGGTDGRIDHEHDDVGALDRALGQQHADRFDSATSTPCPACECRRYRQCGTCADATAASNRPNRAWCPAPQTRSSDLRAADRFTSDDLPALGRPTIAIAVSVSSAHRRLPQVLRRRSSESRSRRGLSSSFLTISSSRSPTAVAMLGADLNHGVEAEAVEFERAALRARRSSLLLIGEDHRHAGVARRPWRCPDRRESSPSRPSTTITIRSAAFKRAGALHLDELVERILAGAEQAARVGQLEAVALPRHGMRDDVARRAGDRGDDRASAHRSND